MAHKLSEHGGEQTNTPKGVCSCSFAEQPPNNVRECSLFAKNVRRAPRIADADKLVRR